MKSLPRLPHAAKALFVVWAFTACGGGARGQRDSGPPGGDVGGDAAVDAGLDAGQDSGTDAGGLEYPVCEPQFHDLPWGTASASNVERNDVEYEFVVTQVLEMGFLAELDPERELDDEPRMSVILPRDMAASVRLPELGEPIISLGGSCDQGSYSGYVRVTTLSGELIYEGGAPFCADLWVALWPEPPRLSQSNVPSERCIDYWNNPPPPPEFCCVTRADMEVVLHEPEGDSVVVPGEDRVIDIDGLPYLVSSQGAYRIDQGPGYLDLNGPRGSAFIVRLADSI